MPLDLAIPHWLHQYILAWCDRLCLKDWRIKVSIELCINDDPNVHAMCKQHPDMNEATLLFRADIEDVKDWRRTVIHELIHVAHSRIDHAVEDSLIPQLSEAARQSATISTISTSRAIPPILRKHSIVRRSRSTTQKRQIMHQSCRIHDTPDGARFCIQCGAVVATEGRTERLRRKTPGPWLSGW